jgi:hypothetical protein
MATRDELLLHLWTRVINSHLRPDEIDRQIAHSKTQAADAPFADTGPALERLLAAGVARRDLQLVLRNAAYSAVFQTLYSIDDPGVDDDDVFMLFEELLSSDPSGMEGRPGSADRV